MGEPVLLEAVRTPFGRPNGAYSDTRPDDLLAFAMRGLMARAAIAADQLDDCIVGCVTQSGEQGANIARLGMLLAGIPYTVPAVSVNRWCGSGQQAVQFAAAAVAAGDADYVLAGGIEHMTRVPLYSDIGGLDQLDPALQARCELVHQAESGERIAERWAISRQAADAYGMESMRRASRAATERRHREMLATTGLMRSGAPLELRRDEGIRDTIDPAKVASLQLSFRPSGQGVLTAANSSQIADGAAAVLIGDRRRAMADGLRPRARFLARVAVGDDPTLALTGVIPATRLALKRAGLSLADIDWIEINEAFSTVVLAWARELGADLNKVNPWGGAIAHGHALGATGAALTAKMLAGLEATGGTLGLLTICIGHGQATAMIVERID
ncbi:MAG: thiolase family protein [Pirellulales bacterium]|nr:thiolase family protein [Pirellulales bacterium]